MNEYVLMALIITATTLGVIGLIYLKFKRGLATKIFALVFPAVGVCSFMAFWTAKQGTSVVSVAIGLPVVLLTLPTSLIMLYRITVKALEGSIADLLASSVQISSTAEQSAATAAEQASSVAEISTTVAEINQTSQAAAGSAQAVVRVAEDAVERGHRGQEAIAEAVGSVETIGEEVDGVANRILKLNEKNEQIGEIVESVRSLAEQSNLLAVNASIEAAKAGEHGIGFAVVAVEVRSLAEQSKRSTQQIQRLLVEIQKSSEAAVTATELARKSVSKGTHSIASVREVVEDLAAVLEESADKARQIAGASAQQSAGIRQIDEAMENVAHGGQDTASAAKQLEEAVTNLGDIGKRLDRLVSG